MRLLPSVVASAVLLVSLSAAAQDPSPQAKDGPLDQGMSLGQMTPTPEMWFYDQAQRMYRDPKVAVRQQAEFRATQRRNRLAAQRWFGYSNSRPTVNPTPYTGTYSPMWTSNSIDPSQWSGIARQPVVVQPRYVPAAAAYGLW